VELAAARVQAVSLSQILKQLDHRFDFLVSRKRDVSGRQRTLRATLEWSIRLLPPDAQTLLNRLSVFRGGWTLESAEAVCDVPDTLGGLETLCGGSLIQSEDGGETVRFRMLESIRELAEERLTAEERDVLQQRHADHLLSMAETNAPLLNGPSQREALDRFERELENLRAALRWCGSREEEWAKGLRMAVSLCPFWLERGYITEGRQWLRELLSSPPARPEDHLLTRARNGAGLLALWQGDNEEAESLLRSALHGAETAGDDSGMAYALIYRGLSEYNRGDYQGAERSFLGGLALFRTEADAGGEALSHSRLGAVYKMRGEYPLAIRHCLLAQKLYREQGDRAGESSVLNILGIIHTRTGRYREARDHLDQALSLKRMLGDKLGISIVLQNQAIALQSEGKNAEACPLYEESLRLRRELGDKGGVVNILYSHGIALTALGDSASARRCFLEGLALQRELGHRGGLEGYAGLLAREGEDEKATRFFAAEEANRQAMGTPLPPDEVPAHDRYLDLLKTRMGRENFESAWKEGYGLGWEEAADEALGRAWKEA
jgi:tetratricopeptide (TPR) repeat protein